jgi:IclR family acetate operon transcriptional repressor
MTASDIPNTKVGVLDKAMAVLRAFPRGGVALTPAEIALRTDLPLPTVYRLAQAMAEHGMLERDGARFQLGVTLLHLGALVAEGMDLRRQARPHLQWLAERTGENVELHIRHGADRTPIEVIPSPQSLRPIVDIGAPISLHAGSGGKALLAWLPLAEATALARASAARVKTERQLDLTTLPAELAQTRAQGWAFSDSEGRTGIASIAAPIFDASGEAVGVILLSAPSVRLPARKRQLYTPLVVEAAQRASRDLGYHPAAGQSAASSNEREGQANDAR